MRPLLAFQEQQALATAPLELRRAQAAFAAPCDGVPSFTAAAAWASPLDGQTALVPSAVLRPHLRQRLALPVGLEFPTAAGLATCQKGRKS